jgi:hypothetical protein
VALCQPVKVIDKFRELPSSAEEVMVDFVRESSNTKSTITSRGGVDARSRKSCEASLFRADGVVLAKNFLTTPPRPLHQLHQRMLRGFFLCRGHPSSAH